MRIGQGEPVRRDDHARPGTRIATAAFDVDPDHARSDPLDDIRQGAGIRVEQESLPAFLGARPLGRGVRIENGKSLKRVEHPHHMGKCRMSRNGRARTLPRFPPIRRIPNCMCHFRLGTSGGGRSAKHFQPPKAQATEFDDWRAPAFRRAASGRSSQFPGHERQRARTAFRHVCGGARMRLRGAAPFSRKSPIGRA